MTSKDFPSDCLPFIAIYWQFMPAIIRFGLAAWHQKNSPVIACHLLPFIAVLCQLIRQAHLLAADGWCAGCTVQKSSARCIRIRIRSPTSTIDARRIDHHRHIEASLTGRSRGVSKWIAKHCAESDLDE